MNHRSTDIFPAKRKRSYKLIVDPALKQGLHKVFRVEGVVQGSNSQAYPVVVEDPRTKNKSAWVEIPPSDFQHPKFRKLVIDSILKREIASVPCREVTLSNLNNNCDLKFLRDICSPFGEVDLAKIYENPDTKQHMGVGKIIFRDPESVGRCVGSLHNKPKMGNVISVVPDTFGRKRGKIIKELINQPNHVFYEIDNQCVSNKREELCEKSGSFKTEDVVIESCGKDRRDHGRSSERESSRRRDHKMSSERESSRRDNKMSSERESSKRRDHKRSSEGESSRRDHKRSSERESNRRRDRRRYRRREEEIRRRKRRNSRRSSDYDGRSHQWECPELSKYERNNSSRVFSDKICAEKGLDKREVTEDCGGRKKISFVIKRLGLLTSEGVENMDEDRRRKNVIEKVVDELKTSLRRDITNILLKETVLPRIDTWFERKSEKMMDERRDRRRRRRRDGSSSRSVRRSRGLSVERRRESPVSVKEKSGTRVDKEFKIPELSHGGQEIRETRELVVVDLADLSVDFSENSVKASIIDVVDDFEDLNLKIKEPMSSPKSFPHIPPTEAGPSMKSSSEPREISNRELEGLPLVDVRSARMIKPLFPPSEIKEFPARRSVFRRRSKASEESIVSEYLTKGISQEEIGYLKTAYEQLLSSEESPTWVFNSHWEYQCPTKLLNYEKARTSRRSSQIPIGECSRTLDIDAIKRLSKAHKDTWSSQRAVNTVKSMGSRLGGYEMVDSQSVRTTIADHKRMCNYFAARGDMVAEKLKFNNLNFRKKQLKFRRSGIHSWGLFADEHIPADDLVIEYVGSYIRMSVAEVREQRYLARGVDSSYLFKVDDFWCIDATMEGNFARFINHSCNPNCSARVVEVDGNKKVCIYSKRDIHRGEEVTYDYKFSAEEEDKIPCYCGAHNCRKYLN